MRKLVLAVSMIAVVLSVAVSCSSDEESTWEKYTDWRETNEQWLRELASMTNDDGTPYYQRYVPSWTKASYVLIHYFNDRSATEGNLSPLSTSSGDVRYVGHLCTGERFDSTTTLQTSYGYGIARFVLSNTIPGWVAALPQMRVGDTAQIVCPYAMAYGAQEKEVIKPYSALSFNLRLVDVHTYEATPY